MELGEVLRRRRMVHRFLPDPVPAGALNRILAAAMRAPSAGFSQGWDLLVLDSPEQLDNFWGLTLAPDLRAEMRDPPPLVILPIPDREAYLARYSLPDKAAFGLGASAERWPVPYWDLDTAMAVMLMLLQAVDEGLGAWYFGIARGEAELLASLGVPAGRRPIGAVGIGVRHPEDRPAGSALSVRRRPAGDAVHRNHWQARC